MLSWHGFKDVSLCTACDWSDFSGGSPRTLNYCDLPLLSYTFSIQGSPFRGNHQLFRQSFSRIGHLSAFMYLSVVRRVWCECLLLGSCISSTAGPLSQATEAQVIQVWSWKTGWKFAQAQPVMIWGLSLCVVQLLIESWNRHVGTQR